MKISRTLIVAILLTAQLAFALQLEATHDYVVPDFCWKDSYGRGAGTVPNDCGKKEKLGALCYERCSPGYMRVGLDCQQLCPQGFRNDGLFCRMAEYGRGAGYRWRFKDGLKNRDRGMYRRCESDHGKGNCQKKGAIVYPKCKKGYSAVGCCICRPWKPDCAKLGMKGRFDLSCAKKIEVGRPSTPTCPNGKYNDAGLCYKPCRQGYNGIGPVCWGKNPNGWVDCGFGAAKGKATCSGIIFGQVTSIGMMALNVATLGTAGAAAQAAKAGKNAERIKKLRTSLRALKAAVKTAKVTAKIVQIGKKIDKDKNKRKLTPEQQKAADAANSVDELNSVDETKISQAEIVRITALIASLFDPTGIASTIESYSYLKCSQIVKK